MMEPASHTVLEVLELNRASSIQHLVEKTSLSPDAVRRALVELETEDFASVTREKVSQWHLTETGKETLSKGSLPEQRLCELLQDAALFLDELRKKFPGSPQEFSAAFGLAKRSNWIKVESSEKGAWISLTDLGKKSVANSPAWQMLQALSREEFPPQDSPIVKELQARGLIAQKIFTNENARLTEKGKSAQGKTPQSSGNQIGPLTPQMLASGTWKDATFKPYDVKAGVEDKFPGRIHPLRHTIRDVRRIMVELGFQEMEGPLVETAFWNMDAMFIPQDHPAREIQDTFYLPGQGVLENADLVKRVKSIHEHGGKTGSSGFGYEWDPKPAMQLLLRTHTTATTFREFGKGMQHPQKRFAIGRIFRNEALDATHLAEFHQVEGFIMGEGLTLRHLMGIIQEFYAKIGITKIKFKPTYNPYTEPSMEALGYSPELGKWIELINSGMFRKESLAPFGINVPVIAWGFGLERLAMILYAKKSLKEIMGPDVDVEYIRRYPGTKHRLSTEKGE